VLLAFVLFMPMRRYTLPFDAGIQLEPYRVLVAFIVAGWGAMLLADRGTTLRRTGLEGPILAIALTTMASIVLNLGEIADDGATREVLKSLTFLASFFLVLYLVVSTLDPSRVVGLVKLLVLGGVVLAAFAIYESRSGYNLFDHLTEYLPFLRENWLPDKAADAQGYARGGRERVYASAEHPIALAAALCMVLPLAVALAVKRSRWWWLAVSLIAMAVLATLARTGVVMLATIAVVFVLVRPRETLRLWWTVIPILFVVHLVLPNTLGIIKSSFLPQEGLLAEQRSSAGSETAGGRLTDIGPVLDRVAAQPALGVGFGSQVWTPEQSGGPQTGEPARDAGTVANHGFGEQERTRILDNQWLGTLLETGVLGALAWAWLFWRFCGRVRRRAGADDSTEAWLAAGVLAGVTAQVVGMLTYDALAFVQATFILFFLIAFGVLLGTEDRARPAAAER
jgi:O-antigen ligase